MSEADFEVLSNILYSPSPVNFEAAMTNYISKETQKFGKDNWKYHKFNANAGLVIDTDPSAGSNKLSVMVMGHADKIRLQVKKVASDGKVYIASDSHIPISLLGNEVSIFSENSAQDGYNRIEGGTVEALGAIHFADAATRTGSKGLKAEQMYVELHIHGEKCKEQVTEGLGIKAGDTILMQRKIRRGVGLNTFTGSHLDNGVGSFVTYHLSKLVSNSKLLDEVRFLFAYSSHEEIGRFGSRQIVNQLKPDVLIAVDVNHDYSAAPGIGGKNMPEITMGKGPTVGTGSVTSNFLNSTIIKAAKENEIPIQLDQNGTDTGTDAMASVLSNKDVVCTSVGVPVRNMHTVSECGVTDDVYAASFLIQKSVEKLVEEQKTKGKDIFKTTHPDLSKASVVDSIPESFYENLKKNEENKNNGKNNDKK